MIVLTVRTDKPEAEIGLYDGEKQKAYCNWTAHRQLAETLHGKIRDLLVHNQLNLKDIQGIACYAGPGSFTGLRIGVSVANALAYSLAIPIVAIPASESWQKQAIRRLLAGEADKLALPEYGAEAHITLPAQTFPIKH